MADKKGMKGSGGARPNSGPAKGVKYKPRDKGTLSDNIKNGILAAAAKLAEKYGKTIEEAMLELIYDDDTQVSVKASVFKTYLDALVVKASEQKIDVSTKQEGPVVYLPEQRPDPALEVIEGGKNG